MRLALVYDRLNKLGGAEKILESLHNIWPAAPWYTSVFDPSRATFASGWQVKTSFLQKIPFSRRRHELFPVLMPFIFESFDLSACDVVVSVTSAEAKGVITKSNTLHVNYCLTPTRYLWSHRLEYLSSNQFGLLKRLMPRLTDKLQETLKKWDTVAATRPDVMISISEHVKKRVKKYYNRDSVVIYPPVDIKKFTSRSAFVPSEQDYYLTVSRLVPYKKLDLLVKAFNQLGKNLVIIGSGSEEKYLRKIAGPTVSIKGQVTEEQLLGYYQHARAFVQVNEEDFGIAMVEAQAAGLPVIAFGVGGAVEIVNSGVTGLLFANQTLNAIIGAVRQSEATTYNSQACRENAKRFDKDIFVKKFTREVEKEWQNYQRN